MTVYEKKIEIAEAKKYLFHDHITLTYKYIARIFHFSSTFTTCEHNYHNKLAMNVGIV